MSKEQEVHLDDEPLYKSCPILDVEPAVSNKSNMQPPPLTRRLNMELDSIGELDLHRNFTKDDSLDNIVDG